MKQARYLVGFARRRMFLMKPRNVMIFELRAHLVHATLVSGETYTLTASMTTLARALDPTRFFRAHRAVMVNLDHVHEIERSESHGCLRLVCLTKDGAPHTVPVSRPASMRLRRALALADNRDQVDDRTDRATAKNGASHTLPTPDARDPRA